jgi:hypothetical protein
MVSSAPWLLAAATWASRACELTSAAARLHFILIRSRVVQREEFDAVTELGTSRNTRLLIALKNLGYARYEDGNNEPFAGGWILTAIY